MRHEFGDSIAAYVIQPGTPVTGGRLAVLRGGTAVWFYNADSGGTRYTDLVDAANVPITEVITTNASVDMGYMPKFKGPDGVTGFWADANGGSGPRFFMETNDAKLLLDGNQTIIGDKAVTAKFNNTNTYTWIMPIQPVAANQIGAVTIENSNTVTPTDSPDLFTIWYKGNTDSKRAGWFNEWGGIRVRVPPLSDLGYADVAAKFFEPSSGGEDGLQVYGPGGTKKFYVRDGAVWADSLTLTGNAVVPTAPTLGTHLTNKTYVDSLVVGGAPDATTSTKGIVQLAGDLSGTATAPTVPGLATKANDADVVHDTGNETIAGIKTFSSSPEGPTPTTASQLATKAYADSVGGGTPPDATTSTKGIVQLAGDLDGTAAAPTVPGLLLKANDADVVKLTGAQAVAGVKSFSSSPTVPAPASGTDAVNKTYADGLITALPASVVPKAATTSGTVGVSATLARADHAHPSRQTGPEHLGKIAWNVPIIYATAGTVMPQAAGTLYGNKIWIPESVTVTNLEMYLTANGAALTAGQNFAALYTGAGALLGTTADQTTNWTSGAAYLTMALSVPVGVTAGPHYVVLFWNGTTAPTFARLSNVSGMANAGLTGTNSLHFTTSDTGRTTTMPATLGTKTAASAGYYVAVS